MRVQNSPCILRLPMPAPAPGAAARRVSLDAVDLREPSTAEPGLRCHPHRSMGMSTEGHQASRLISRPTWKALSSVCYPIRVQLGNVKGETLVNV